MPLRSKLLKANPRLQSCLVNDKAHVTPGSTGDFVRLIQLALGAIDQLDISKGEFESQHYGPTTTAAVLAYKKKRKIINRSYQTSEDNVVGKLTIDALDKDLLAKETTYLDGNERTGFILRRCACAGPVKRASADSPVPVLSADARRSMMQELFA